MRRHVLDADCQIPNRRQSLSGKQLPSVGMMMEITLHLTMRSKSCQRNLRPTAIKKLEVGIIIRNIASIGMYLEYGWTQSVTSKQGHYLSAQLGLPPNSKFTTLYMPPRPFMRATYAQKRMDWQVKFRSRFLKAFDIKHSLGVMGTRLLTISSKRSEKQVFRQVHFPNVRANDGTDAGKRRNGQGQES